MKPENNFKNLNALRVAFKCWPWLCFSSWYVPSWKISSPVKKNNNNKTKKPLIFATFVLYRMLYNISIHAKKLYLYVFIIIVLSNNHIVFLYLTNLHWNTWKKLNRKCICLGPCWGNWEKFSQLLSSPWEWLGPPLRLPIETEAWLFLLSSFFSFPFPR